MLKPELPAQRINPLRWPHKPEILATAIEKVGVEDSEEFLGIWLQNARVSGI